MTTVLQRPTAVPAPRATTRALARAEAVLLMRSPTLWAGVLVTAGLCTSWLWTTQPVWDVVQTDTGMSSLVLAGFLLLLGHLAASRDHRHGAREAASALPVTPAQRTVALLALVPVAGLIGALALALDLLALAPDRPAGVLEPFSLLVPVIVPMIGAAIGAVSYTQPDRSVCSRSWPRWPCCP